MTGWDAHLASLCSDIFHIWGWEMRIFFLKEKEEGAVHNGSQPIPFVANSRSGINGLGPGYLRDGLTPLGLAHTTRASRGGLLWVPSTRLFQLAGSRRRIFSAVAPPCWDISPPPPPMWGWAPTLLSFRKGLKTWLGQWGLQWGIRAMKVVD